MTRNEIQMHEFFANAAEHNPGPDRGAGSNCKGAGEGGWREILPRVSTNLSTNKYITIYYIET
jgi:hypothetical protein